MLEENKRAYLTSKLKREYLLGKITGVPKVPNDGEIDDLVDKILQIENNGVIGISNNFNHREISNPDTYSKNIIETKDNIETLQSAVKSVINNILSQINTSTEEKNLLFRENKNIKKCFEDVENGQIKENSLSYSVSDNFTDNSKVDLDRTTADIDVNAGTVALSKVNSDRLTLPHYTNQNKSLFSISKGLNIVTQQKQTPGTSFNAIFTDDDTDRWEYVVTTSEPGEISGYFTIKLSEVGKPVDINEIEIELLSNYADNGLVKVEYLDENTDKKWKMVPGGLFRMNSDKLNYNFDINPTKYLRINLTKELPDDAEENKYYFGIKSLVIKKSTTSYESEVLTKPIPIESYRKDNPSVYSAKLTVDEEKKDGASIKYFVSIDPPIPGKIVDRNYDVIDKDDESAYAFIPNSGSLDTTENYYEYASDLRARPWISGAYQYNNWEPKWIEIAPMSRKTNNMPTVRYFNNTYINKELHDMAYSSKIKFGDVRYTGPWPATGNEWADDWEHNDKAHPKTGFIWGEDPFSWAGIWWGDSIDYPGWWRPNLPDASGNQTWDDTIKISYPDYTILSDDGSQKHFWKIFHWPSEFKPIPGSVKLHRNYSDENYNENEYNKIQWNWNYRGAENIKEEEEIILDVEKGDSFVILDLDKKIDNPSAKLIEGSISDLKFLNMKPDVIEDFYIDYGYTYSYDEDGKLKREREEVGGKRATISFPSEISTYYRRTGDSAPSVKIKFSYSVGEPVEASWETYVFIPENTLEGKRNFSINDYNTAVQNIIVTKIDENGIPKDETQYSPKNYKVNKITLPYGWSKIRVFVDVEIEDALKTDSNIAKWNPNYVEYKDLNSILIESASESGYGRLKIYDSTANFKTNKVRKNMNIDVKYRHNNKDALSDWYSGSVSLVKSDSEIEILLNDPQELHMYKKDISEYRIRNTEASAAVKHDNSIRHSSSQRSMNQVDLYTLMHETRPDDDSKFAIIEDVDGDEYAVVKTPCFFPNNITNNIHYTRKYYDGDIEGNYVTFTTGTDGNTADDRHPLLKSDSVEGTDLSSRPPNTFPEETYAQNSCYRSVIQVDRNDSDGFLFWNTGENLQTYYRISYALPAENRPTNRIMFKAKLISDSLKNTPVLKKYTLVVNEEES